MQIYTFLRFSARVLTKKHKIFDYSDATQVTYDGKTFAVTDFRFLTNVTQSTALTVPPALNWRGPQNSRSAQWGLWSESMASGLGTSMCEWLTRMVGVMKMKSIFSHLRGGMWQKLWKV